MNRIILIFATIFVLFPSGHAISFKTKLQRMVAQERKRKCKALEDAWYFWQLTSQKNPQEEKKALIAVTACQMPYDELLKKVNEL